MDNKVVYAYFDKEECFYIGMGSSERSFATSQGSRNKHTKNKLEKAKKNNTFHIQILHSGLTKEMAGWYEIQYIRSIGRKDLGTGTLTNMTNGGEGSNQQVGYWKNKKLSKSHRNNISKGSKGRTLTQETRDKQSKSRQGIKLSEEHKRNLSKSHIGVKHSKESRERRSKNSKGENNPFYGKKHPSRKRVVIDDKSYESLSIAAKETGIYLTTISRRCKNKKFSNYRFLS